MNSSPPFHPYGVAHLLVIFLTIALPFSLAALVRWTKSSAIERIIVGALSLTLVINYFVYLSLVRQFGAVSWEQLLPLQLCDWAMVVIIIAMWTRRPRWFEVAYFWGIGGTVQAVLTPNLAFGFPDFRFFSFFVSHCGIIIGIIFLMLVHHLRPHPFSIVRVFAWTAFFFTNRRRKRCSTFSRIIVRFIFSRCICSRSHFLSYCICHSPFTIWR